MGYCTIILKVNSNMSQQSERNPLLVNSCVVKEESENDSTLQVAINPPSTKLQSPLRNKHTEGKAPPYATVAVFYYAVAASFGALVTGCTLSFPSSAVLDLTDSELREEYRFDERLLDIFGLLGPLGALFGGPIGGFLMDYWGRKPSLLLVSLPYFFGYLMMVYAHMINHAALFKVVLMFGRFLTGVGLGWTSSVMPVYVAEISPARLRGMLSFFSQLLLSMGLLLGYLLGSFSSFKYYDAALVIASLGMVNMLLVLPTPETPRWLLVHGKRSCAVATLELLRGKHNDIHLELSETENDIEKTKGWKFSQVMRMVVTRAVLAPLFIILCGVIFQECGGMLAATTYSASIFKAAGVKAYRATSTYSTAAVQVVVTVVAVFLVDTCGRKLLLIISGIGCFIATLMLGVQFYITRPSLCAPTVNNTFEALATDVPSIDCNQQFAPIAIISLMLFFSAFTIGWGPIPGILLGELLPLRVRGVASGIAMLLRWSLAALVSGTYFNVTKLVNSWFVWWFYSLVNLLSVVFVVVFVFETKGKSLEQIEERFRRKQCVHCNSCVQS